MARRKYAQNPFPLLIPLVIALVGGGAATVVVLHKRKKKKELEAKRIPPKPAVAPADYYGPQPSDVPSAQRAPKYSPEKITEEIKKAQQVLVHAQEVGKPATQAAAVVKKAYEFVIPEPTAKPIPAKPPEKPPMKGAILFDEEGAPIGPPEEPPETGEPGKGASKDDAMKAITDEGGKAAVGAAAPSILGVGLGTIAIVAGVAIVAVAAIEAVRKMQRQHSKMRSEIHSWNAMSNSYANQIKKWDAEEIPKLKEGIANTEAQIVRLQTATRAVRVARAG
jgi:uncharacterized integral membrane protein